MHVLIDHPCVQHKLALIRDVTTGHKKFRELATEITEFVCYEALKNVNTREVEIETPIKVAKCRMIDHDIVVVPVLRAGVGMLEGILELVPTARVGFVGLYRDEETKEPVSYYERFPPQAKKGYLRNLYSYLPGRVGIRRATSSRRCRIYCRYRRLPQ
jgi:uracil phosphoribosyltransferase